MRRYALAALFTCAFAFVATSTHAQTNRIDMVSPFAPELATFGTYTVGVRTFDATDPNQILRGKPVVWRPELVRVFRVFRG